MLFKVPFLSLLASTALSFPVPALHLRQTGRSNTLVTLATFNSSASFLEDPPQALGANLSTSGVDVYYGIQAEDGQTGYVLILYDAEHNPIPTPDLQDVLAAGSTNNVSSIAVQTIVPNGDITPILTVAPLTEVTTLALLPNGTGTLPELAAVADELRVKLDGVTGQFGEGHWGTVLEDPTQIKDFVGWESIQEHIALVSTPEFADVGGRIVQIATATSGHVHFTKLT